MFEPKAYVAWKQIFEEINKAETHALVLKPLTVEAPVQASTSPESAPVETTEHATDI